MTSTRAMLTGRWPCAYLTLLVAGSAGAATTLEEVVVTAQKRPEYLQDVPIALSVYDQTLLLQAGIDDIGTLAQFTPGFTLTSYNKSTPQPYIRGIGSNTSGAGDDASVGLFIDEVYISRAGAFDSTLFDLERIEVLRGPQGTLYGKNVAGGAINISTHKPSLEQSETQLRLETGSYQQRGLQLYTNGPMSQQIAGKLSYALNKRDGMVINSVTGTALRNENSQSARGALFWQASGNFTAEVGVDYATLNESGAGRVLQGEPAFGIPALSPSVNNPNRTDSSIDGYTDRKIAGSSAHLHWDQPYGQWTSVTAYRTTDYQFSDELVPALGAPYFINNEADEKQRQFSQEIRLANAAGASPLKWTLGLYYFDEDVARIEAFNTTYLGGGLGLWDANNRTRSSALFAQTSYQLQSWRFNLGGRYTYEQKDFQLMASGYEPLLFSFFSPYQANADQAWRNFSGKASIDYTGIDNLLIYLSYSDGFKSGAFNSLSANKVLAETALKPELAKQWEWGIKSQWLNNRARMNVALFDIHYNDLQVFETAGVEVFVGNAAQASIKGAEIELSFLPLPQLELSANYAYLDARYDEYDLGDTDNSGNQLSRSPKNTGSISALYEIPWTGQGTVTFRLDYLNQGSIFRTADNSHASEIAGYQLLNGYAGFSSNDDRWEISIWGKNLGNRRYEIFRNDLSALGAATSSDIMGDPRTVGISLTFRH